MPRQSKSEKLSSAVNAIASGKNALETKSKKQTKKTESETIEFKSVILGIAYLCRHLELEQAKIASRLEEEFQVEISKRFYLNNLIFIIIGWDSSLSIFYKSLFISLSV